MQFFKKLRLDVKTVAWLTLLLVLLGQNTGISYGQGKWSTPIALSPAGSFAWFPDVIADPYGKVHAVWAAGVEGYDQVIYSSTENGSNWQQPNDLFAVPWTGSNNAATRPTLQIDANGHLNLTFVDLSTIYFSSANLTRTWSVNAWMPKKVMSGDHTAYFSRVAVDSKNILHFVFTQNAPNEACLFCFHLFYRQSVDDGNTWSAAVDLIQEANGAVKPQILVDKGDGIHVVWESGKATSLGQLTNPTSVSYAGSSDGGKTWSNPVNLSKNDSEIGKNIAIGQDKWGNLVVAWLALPQNKIMYQMSLNDGKSWTAPAAIPNVWGPAAVYLSNLDDYSFANDSSGNLHLIAVGTITANQETVDILNLVWDSTRWAKPDVIVTYKGDVPEWPRVSIGEGNQIHVIWFVRDEAHIWQSDSGQYRVWYSHGLADAKFIDPEPLPSAMPDLALSLTPKPIALPTELKTQTPTLTAIALSNATPMAPSRVPQTENDFVLLLAVTVVPSLILIIGAAIFIAARRH